MTHRWTALFAATFAAAGAGCGDRPHADPPAVDLLPALSLAPRDHYFTLVDTDRVVMSRNVTGQTTGDIIALLDQAKAAGSTLVRLHLTQGLGSGVTTAGAVDQTWATGWDVVFDHARAIGLYVVPVLGVAEDWNDGTPDSVFPEWSVNPWNAANGGPARRPEELVQAGSAVRAAWLGWVRALVTRWQPLRNVAAWEVFAELDLMAGAAEDVGTALASDAAGVVRAADAGRRPVMASLSAGADWPSLSGGPAVDIVQVQPYSTDLDTDLLSDVAAKLSAYGKPVMIGESGLSSAQPSTAPNAYTAIRHAIWAGVVSGAMNARALWWEDGYGDPAFVDIYADVEAPAARFAGTFDFAGVKPLPATIAGGVVGAAVGNAQRVAGWFRSAACGPPAWDCGTPVNGATVTLPVPGGVSSWLPVFYDSSTGAPFGYMPLVTRGADGQVTLPLPSNLSDDVVFTLTPWR
jgi:hypothetical protein